MADLVLETSEGVALRQELAGPGTRLLAAALDGLLFLVFYGGALFVLALFGFGAGLGLLASALVVLLVAYWFAAGWLWQGETPGKRAVGLSVVDLRGFAPSTSQLFLRALFVPLEAALVAPVPLVWLLIAVTPRRQRLGDLVAGTVVLRSERHRLEREPVPGLAWSTLERREFALEPAVVRRLGGRDLGFLRTLLVRRELGPMARVRLQLRAAEHYHARLAGARRVFTPDEARTFLRELFLCLREVRSRAADLTWDRSSAAAARDVTPGGGSRPR
jgi:uncharacterized RDD family membrane protein YckC